ncbi:SHOCT domain-containing protein [Haloplanus rubicundus]|nr:SHOCT domain-containing protein [Haloplanus rubicundus]
MQLLSTLAELPVAQWGPGPHGPGPHGPHWGGGPMGPMGPAGPGTGAVGLGFGGWWLVLLFALLVVGVVAAAFYLQSRETGRDGGKTEDGALAVLRERYAAGDVDQEEFERRRDRLAG